MKLNFERFEELIDTYAVERWKQKIDDWELRPGGRGKIYPKRCIGKNESSS